MNTLLEYIAVAAAEETQLSPSDHRRFDTGDDATDHNLRILDHLSQIDAFDGPAELMHNWLVSINSAQKLLPRAAARHFEQGRYLIGRRHFEAGDRERALLWQWLAFNLSREVEAAYADPALRKEARPDLSDRPKTRAEILTTLCAKVQTGLLEGSDVSKPLAKLAREAAGTEVASDVKKLQKLLSKPPTGDQPRHRAELIRIIYHARRVAGHLHHLE